VDFPCIAAVVHGTYYDKDCGDVRRFSTPRFEVSIATFVLSLVVIPNIDWLIDMDGWMDGWMCGWMDGCVDGWMCGWMDVLIDWLMDGWMDGCVDWLMMRVWLWIQPDGNHIVARLMEIRDYIQQATGMLEALGTHRDPVMLPCLCDHGFNAASN